MKYTILILLIVAAYSVSSSGLTYEGYKDKFRSVTYGDVELTEEVVDDMFTLFIDKLLFYI